MERATLKIQGGLFQFCNQFALREINEDVED